MKKNRIIAVLIISMLLTSCSISNPFAKKTVENDIEQTQEETKVNNEKSNKIEVSSSPTDISGFEVMGRYEYNISGNENDDIVTLYSSVKRDDEGNLLWDDSQTWILQVETDDGVYELYRKKFSGNVYFNLSEFYFQDATKNVITLFENTNVSNKVIEYTYNDKTFEEVVKYSTDEKAKEGINPLYSSIPNYK